MLTRDLTIMSVMYLAAALIVAIYQMRLAGMAWTQMSVENLPNATTARAGFLLVQFLAVRAAALNYGIMLVTLKSLPLNS